jgi:hypothetical protein
MSRINYLCISVKDVNMYKEILYKEYRCPIVGISNWFLQGNNCN